MISRCFIFICSLIFTSGLFAQEVKIEQRTKFYSKVSAGYSFRSGGDQNGEVIQHANGTYTQSYTPFSYGKGTNISYALGYMFNKNIGAEVGMSYFIGGKNKEYNFYDDTTYAYTIGQTISYKANLFRLNPAIVIAADFEKVIPYAKVGFIVGWGTGFNTSSENAYYRNGSKPSSGSFEWKLYGARAFGYTSSIGINIKSKDETSSFFIELTHIGMAGNFKKISMTKSEIDGKGNLGTLTTSQKEGVFVDEVTVGGTQDPSKPKEILKHNSSFNSLGINIGLFIKMR